MEKFLVEIDGLRIFAKNRLPQGGAGLHKGRGRGFSLDFYGHLPYLPGEDIRRIDWKAYARTEHLYLKEFSEERQLQISVILDSSVSMDYGDPCKWDSAQLLALGLAYLALKQGDRLSFHALNEGINTICRNLVGRAGFYEVRSRVKLLRPAGRTDLSPAAGLYPPAKAGLVFIISDLMTTDLEKTLDSLCLAGAETIILHILAAGEINPSLQGDWKLIDKETGQEREVNVTKQVIAKYLRRINSFLSETEKLCTERRIRYIFATTEEKPSLVLSKALRGGGR